MKCVQWFLNEFLEITDSKAERSVMWSCNLIFSIVQITAFVLANSCINWIITKRNPILSCLKPVIMNRYGLENWIWILLSDTFESICELFWFFLKNIPVLPTLYTAKQLTKHLYEHSDWQGCYFSFQMVQITVSSLTFSNWKCLPYWTDSVPYSDLELLFLLC